MKMIRLKSEKDLIKLRISGKILAETLDVLKEQAREGVNCLDIEKNARRLIKSSGAKPAFLGYVSHKISKPYPSATCISINSEIVHTIPYDYVLKSGDVVKIDIGIKYKGYITDGAITVLIGEYTKEAKRLKEGTKEALIRGIDVCAPGKRTGDIGNAIEKTLRSHSLSPVEKLVGHGVGFELHEPPPVPNKGEKGSGELLEEGMVIAIEPMASLGSGEIIEKDNGSFLTKNGSLSAHFERTIAITKDGYEILTPTNLT